MFTVQHSALAGCLELQPKVVEDLRGRFVKPFHADEFARLGLASAFCEQYYSHSHRGVIRGLHFQTPPHDHAKLVYCVAGEVLDVVVDIRQGSPTFGHVATFALSAAKGNAVYIAPGMAHGFCVLSEQATLIYNVTSAYSPAHDAGILWSSIELDWPVHDPVVSARDQQFPTLACFDTPFRHV